MEHIGYMIFGGLVLLSAYLLIIIDKLKEILEELKKDIKEKIENENNIR